MNRFSSFGVLSAVLLALLPFVTSRHLFFGAVNTKYFLVVGAVLLLGGFAAALYFRGKQMLILKNRPLLWAGLALLGVYWLAALLGVFPERSLFADIQRSTGVIFLTHVAFLALILGEFLSERDWLLIRRTIALSAGLFGFFALLGGEGIGISGRFLWMNLNIPGFTFGNSTFAGAYLLLAFVVAFIEIMRIAPWTRWWYALTGSATLIIISPIFLSVWNIGNIVTDPISLLGSARASSATAILLLIFFSGYLLLRRYTGGYEKYVLPAWGGLFVLGFIAGVALLFTPGSVVQEKYTEVSTGARLLVWQGGLESFKERPLLGWGMENFEQAFQKHFDNRLYEDKYLGEVWFDRAHNIIVDTLVDVGVLGALALLATAGAFAWAAYRARKSGLIGEGETVLLFALPLMHFLQLQTGFDTVGSYTLLGVLGGYALWLERAAGPAAQKQQAVFPAPATYYKGGAVVLGILVLSSAYFSAAELNRQYSLYRIFIETNSERRLERVEAATSRLSSFESLRLSSLSLVKGALGVIAEGKASQEIIQTALSQIEVYEDRYRRYIEEQPDYYRARMALAYLLSVKVVLGGENELSEAKELVAKGYELSPENLITPAMEALLELYSGNLKVARQKAETIVALNPNAPFGKEVLAHIKKQEKTFPTITVLKLENL